MGLNFSFLVCSSNGTLDLTRPLPPAAADTAIHRLFPRTPYRRVGPRRLLERAFPERERPVLGAFEGGLLIATRDAHLYDPGILHTRYLRLTGWRDVRLLTSRSINDMFAYGHWCEGRLMRCISVNTTAGVWRDDGQREEWESDTLVVPDRWLDLANGALHSALRLSGDAAPLRSNVIDWDEVSVYEYGRSGQLLEQ